MITDLLRLGLRLTMVAALFVVGGTIIATVNPPVREVVVVADTPLLHSRVDRVVEPLAPKPTKVNRTPPKPRHKVKEVVITPKPTHSVIKHTAAPPRKPVSKPKPVPKPRPKPTVLYSSPALAKGYARQHVSAYQFACLAVLWTRESGWNYHAYNASSGAYGIPQALPGTKMASFGADWRNSYIIQVNWGLNYIKTRYGSPCSAWSHEIKFGWY